ncbi:MAG TPA: prolipoprotein diacylglyceryl transferase [Candidatus Limnocylindrales bacterium]|nr:prolipoprotein diacylglyceryl transferase [Candidatus Limnocylindrales bacterium]
MIDPVAFEIGPLKLHWYGIIIASAVLIAGLLGTRVARWLNEDPDDGWSMLLLVMVLAVIGARLYHVIHLWGYYAENPVEIPMIWNGGVGIPGGVAGGALGIWLYTRPRGLSAARWMDIFAPALLLGQVIGRLGNFVNQELYGPPTSLCGTDFPPCLPWGIQIDAAHRAGTPWDAVTYPPETTTFVPLFAYEMVLNLIGMLVILFLIRRFGPRLFAGDAVLMYIMWYGAVRTVLETYRVNNWTILGVPTAMWVGIIGFVLAGAWLWYRHRRGRGSPMIRPADEGGSDVDAAPAQPHPEATAG